MNHKEPRPQDYFQLGVDIGTCPESISREAYRKKKVPQLKNTKLDQDFSLELVTNIFLAKTSVEQIIWNHETNYFFRGNKTYPWFI